MKECFKEQVRKKVHSVPVEVYERAFQRSGTKMNESFKDGGTDKSLNETAFQRWGTKMKHCFKDGVRMFETIMFTEYILKKMKQSFKETRMVENFDTYGYEMNTAAYMRVLNNGWQSSMWASARSAAEVDRVSANPS